MNGIEPSSSDWKSDALTVVLHLQDILVPQPGIEPRSIAQLTTLYYYSQNFPYPTHAYMLFATIFVTAAFYISSKCCLRFVGFNSMFVLLWSGLSLYHIDIPTQVSPVQSLHVYKIILFSLGIVLHLLFCVKQHQRSCMSKNAVLLIFLLDLYHFKDFRRIQVILLWDFSP